VERCSNVCQTRYKWVDECKTKCKTRYRDERVYDYFCHYTVDAWLYWDTVTATGNDQSPHWPETSDHGCASVGCKRAGRHSEDYTARLSYDPGGGKTEIGVVCPISQQELSRMRIGAVHMGQLFWGSFQCRSIDYQEVVRLE
jgi:hypothetical protein